jgi:hypothetical protein
MQAVTKLPPKQSPFPMVQTSFDSQKSRYLRSKFHVSVIARPGRTSWNARAKARALHLINLMPRLYINENRLLRVSQQGEGWRHIVANILSF